MSSILTNNGAMVALQTLKSVNANMAEVQNQISTGKAVANAKDNSAIWAISAVMSSDVVSFKGISDSLNLAQSTVAVARQASETVTDLLTEIKGKIVASQEENVDREKIQTDITALREQISAVVGAAQFNGLNLLQNSGLTDQDVSVLASLDRSGSGVTASNIDVARQDLGNGTAVAGTMGTDIGSNSAIADGNTAAAFTLTGTPEAGMSYQIDSGGALGLSANVVYVARNGDTLSDVRNALIAKANFQAITDGVDVSFSANATAGQVDLTNNSGASITIATAGVSQAASNAENDGTIGGSLEMLEQFDVTTGAGADAALEAVESMLQVSIEAAANFGSAQGRIETQNDFIASLTDALKSGIGSLVDADMEEASARLQAVQVQQQLGVQALSIANQAPQQLLSLFQG
ncbi:flagellin [Tropicibacter sp. R15_0]|uniref:flagellin N-terminal helical domain-containing protein n=1 Tax=Tropicibacter sp. R15_0 TaxID=2821101 RepID=UPI001ADA4521|nr:flagellin [Tropicibacter sp. R15_0]MBO9466083.1 flagellin [Tropicibacter sp. R15_0]